MALKIGVKTKLVATMLGAIILATLAMGAASIFGFRRGFLGYLNQQGQSQLDATLPRITALYAEHGGWEYLRQHPSVWFEMVGLPGGLTEAPTVGTPFAPHYIDVT